MTIDTDTAVFNPTAVFSDPQEILLDTKIKLSQKQKIQALETWRYDIQLKHVAEAENMQPSNNEGKEDQLEEKILAALQFLEENPSLNPSPNKSLR